MNLHIIKSKIISQFSKITYILFTISIVYCCFYIYLGLDKSNYNLQSTEFIGTIENIVYKNEYMDVYVDDLIIKVNSSFNMNLKEGMRIKVYGKCKYPESLKNHNLFDYKKYLKSKSINYIVSAQRINIVKYDVNLMYKIRNKISEIIGRMNNKEYLFAFVLGDSSYLDSNIKEIYQFIGISHLFAVSGMHISFLTNLIMKTLSKLNIFKKSKYLLVFLFLFIYCFLTSFTLSIMRATLLYVLCIIKKENNLNIQTKYILICLFSIFLLINPYYIYNIGFLFSYIISYFLIAYRELINRNNSYASKLLMTSIISFLASMPLIINNYFSINLLTPLYNLILVPLVSFIIFPLSIITIFFPLLSPLLSFFICGMEYIAYIFNTLKFFNITLSHISINLLLFYYIVIIIFLNKLQLKQYKYILILILLLFFHYNINFFNKYTIINFINIGQGDSYLISLSNNGGYVLIDCGGNKNYNNSDNIIIPFLKSNGISKLNYLIITHGDYDHMGEAINLVENFKVEKVIFNCGPYNDLENELIKILDNKKIPYYSCIKELNIDNNKLYFLNNKDYGNENDNSSVIYTELNKHKFLFMGDAGVEVEEDLIEKYNLQNIDVLKVGHHGSRTSSGKEFIDEINPKYSIVSVGKNNRYGHPNSEVLENLSKSNVYRTDQDGSIMFKIKNDRLKIENCSP